MNQERFAKAVQKAYDREKRDELHRNSNFFPQVMFIIAVALVAGALFIQFNSKVVISTAGSIIPAPQAK